MRLARKLELLRNVRSYWPLWRTFAAAPGSGGLCPETGAANNKSSEATKIVHERLFIVSSLAVHRGQASC